jgi:hypothetical protein
MAVRCRSQPWEYGHFKCKQNYGLLENACYDFHYIYVIYGDSLLK